MKSYRLIGILWLAVGQAFMTTTYDYDTKTRRLLPLQRRESQLARISKPLFLHVDNLHPHRDSVVRLEDDIPIDHDVLDKNKMLHKLTNHVAPIVLATYLVIT